jgi:RNA polymerase sigma-54 factor
MQLSQRMALQQVLAPQLQQSLALLQAPILELKALVEQELQHNPVLEEMPAAEAARQDEHNREEAPLLDRADPQEPPAELKFDPATERSSAPVDDFQAEFDRLVQMDQEWRDYFSQTNVSLRSTEEDEERRQFMLDSLVAGTSLQEHLLEQVRLSDLPAALRPIAEMIVGNIDERGYLQAGVDELAFATSYPPDQVREVLDVIQKFDPPGVGARDLRECLLLQLERAGRKDSLEWQIVQHHMDLLARHRFPEIARALSCDIEDVQRAARRISQLEPRPGRDFEADNNHYVSPEIFIRKVGDDYVVSTNNEGIPHLRISNTYKDLMAQPNSTPEVQDYIREKIRAGKFLIKSIQQRQETLLKIARELVNRQRDFLERGPAHLRPMTMAQIAQVVGVHETTISRAVAGKYVETPQGVFELRYFFTSGIPTANGDGVSNESVKRLLQELVAGEDRAKPLSDEEIVRQLNIRGIMIARRTVAKYRFELNILPSHLRRVY